MIFQNGITEINLWETTLSDDLSVSIYKLITSELTYVYINAEVDIDSTIWINSETVNLIKWWPISREISDILSKERSDGNTIIDEINNLVIHHFDNTIVKKLKEIDTWYDYKNTTPGAKSTLNKNTLAELAIQAVFTNRWLVKKRWAKDISLSDMSSGQRRSALLDFLIAVVSSLSEHAKKNLIIWIDEPEISVWASSRIQQFHKIQMLSESLNAIVFTTHWYGWIQQITVGWVILIDEQDKRNHAYYNINTSLQWGTFPPFQLRMIFDFITSLWEWTELDSQKKFIIVEWPTDKIYIDKHFEDHDFKILTARGSSILILINTFKTFSWRWENWFSNLRILIDTDVWKVDEIKNAMSLWSTRRISRNDTTGEVKIIQGNSDLTYKADIEDLLSPKAFLKSLQTNIDKLNSQDDKDYIGRLEIKYPKNTGIWSFWLDQVGTVEFYRIFKGEFKEAVALQYRPDEDEKSDFKKLFKLFPES